MASPVFHGFLSSLFLHLGCFLFFLKSPSTPSRPPPPDGTPRAPPRDQLIRKPIRKISPVSSSPPPSDAPPKSPLSLHLLSYLTSLFSYRARNNKPSPSAAAAGGDKDHWTSTTTPRQSSPPATRRGSFSSRNEIFPCPSCGEVLTKPDLLELHQATRHALSELRHGDSGASIVQIIFQSGWKDAEPPAVHAVLKIHNTARTLALFEEYRELVRSRASSAVKRAGSTDGDHERCIADGNERLRFYCSTVQCSLGREDQETSPLIRVCGGQFCSTCAIVRNGFTGKQADLDGIATHATSWDAHLSLSEDLEQDLGFLKVRRAMLVCRVIAGRVARCGGAVRGGGKLEDHHEEEEEEEDRSGAVVLFDSVVPMRPSGGGPRCSWAEDEELVVVNPRAVLPCFIIVYTTAATAA